MNPQRASYPSYSGDRILVGKFIYQLADPKRWDVIVFKFPGDATTDAEPISSNDWSVCPARRSAFNTATCGFAAAGNRSRLRGSRRRSCWPCSSRCSTTTTCRRSRNAVGPPAGSRNRRPTAARPAGGTRTTTRRFIPTARRGRSWLRYHHLVPSCQQWEALQNGHELSPRNVAPQLIKDFTAYNTARPRAPTAPCRIPIVSACIGWATWRCVHGRPGKRQGRVDLRVAQRADGDFNAAWTLADPGHPLVQRPRNGAIPPAAVTGVIGHGRHEIRFANCDNELRLWIDGSVVQFDAPTCYDDLGTRCRSPAICCRWAWLPEARRPG